MITDNALAPSGHLIVGWKNLFSNSVASNLIPVNNFVIDGSNNGTDSRDLTFQNTASAYTGARILTFYGSCTGATIKNCKVVNKQTTISTPVCIYFGTQSTGPTVASKPQSCLVSNCDLFVNGGGSGGGGVGVQCATRGTVVGAMGGMSDVTVTRCFIVARQKAIHFNSNSNAVISNNTCRIVNGVSGLMCAGISHNSSNTSSGTMNIYGNVLDALTSANTFAGTYGMIGIECAGAPASGSYTYNVYNNMISGFKFTAAATANNMTYRGIAFGSTISNNYVYHNSIRMDNQTNLTGLTGDTCSGIGFAAGSPSGILIAKNNIIWIDQTGGAGILKRTATGTLTSDYNVIYAAGSANTGRYNYANYATLANWQSAGYDTNSQSVDPTTTPNAWASATDLHFSPTDGGAYPMQGVPQISGITTDIDGDARSAICWPGADELPGVDVPVELSGFDAE